jgi:hypothetical protein
MRVCLVFFLFLFGSLPCQARADEIPYDAKGTLNAFLATHLSEISWPESGRNFYTLCTSKEGQLFFGYEGGRCVAFGIDTAGRIEYLPVKIRAVKLGVAVGGTAHIAALHPIGGIDSLDDIGGAYLYLASGAGLVKGAQITYFTKKIGWNGAGDSPDTDVSPGGFEANILTLGVLWYQRAENAKSQWTTLTHAQLRAIDSDRTRNRDLRAGGTFLNFGASPDSEGGGPLCPTGRAAPELAKVEIAEGSDLDAVCRRLTKSPDAVEVAVNYQETGSPRERYLGVFHTDGSVTIRSAGAMEMVKAPTSIECLVKFPRRR